MQKKELKERVLKEHKSAKRALKSFIKKGDQEKLHRFRTGIKKLRALVTLVENTAPLPHLRRQLKPIRETYQLSGKVRDSYLQMELGRKEHTSRSYIAEEQKELEKAVTELRIDRRSHFKKLNYSKTRLLKQLCSIKNFDLNWFYKNELQAVGEQLSHALSNDDLHTCRKRIKVLLYDLPLVRHVLKQPVNEDYLEQVQTAIGDWHDNLLASEHFPKLRKKTEKLLATVKDITKDFFERATTPVEISLEQID